MHRTHTKFSDNSSVFSNPLTRASSTTQRSESLVTPVDTFGHSCSRAVSPPSERLGIFEKSIRSSRESRYEDEDGGDDVEPCGPYFSLPPDPTAKSTPTRRRTTKDLIGRYESLSLSSTSTDHTKGSLMRESSKTVSRSPPLVGKKGKGKSPLRQSFRNLMAVFSKKPKVVEPKANELPVVEEREALRKTLTLKLPPDGTFGNPFEPQACTSPNAIRSGQLLRLCRDANPSILPVWVDCEATLHPHHLLVIGETSQGNSSTSMITFTQCTDVRSVNMSELETTERRLLPGKPDEFKVFELLFEGRTREKFASRSVQDRALWVNSIWDVVLQNQERKSLYAPSPTNIRSPNTPEGGVSHQAVLNREIEDKPATIRSPSIERELPPIPQIASPLPRLSPYRVELRDPARAHLSPVRSTLLQTPPSSRSQSPSIQNLGSRSMVKKRLAEIQHSGSRMTESTRSERSTRTRQVVSSPNTMVMKELQSLNMCRTTTPSSKGAESIIESYATKMERDSPTPTVSTRVTSVTSPAASSRKSHHPIPSKKTKYLTVEESRDPFSPSSEYSDDAPLSFAAKLFALPEISGLPSNALGITTLTIDETKPKSVVDGLPASSEQPPVVRKSVLPPRKSPLEQSTHPMRATPEPPIQPPRPPSLFKAIQETTPPTIDPAARAVMHNIESSVIRIEGQGRRQGEGISALRDQVDAVLENLRRQKATEVEKIQPPITVTTMQCDQSAVLKRLEEVYSTLAEGFPDLAKRLEELKVEMCSPRRGSVLSMKNIAPSTPEVLTTSAESAVGIDTISQIPDFSELQTKLDFLLTICQSMQEQRTAGENETTSDKPDGSKQTLQVQEILDLLKAEQTHKAAQAEQQADSVRYLNELNSWLEAFVNHGTSQIDQVVSGIQQLCRDLGPMPEMRESLENEVQHADMAGVSLLADIRRLLVENRGREEDTAILQSSVNGLIAAVQEDLKRNAEARNAITTESILGLIERQRQDQERLLRTLASEISDDIRGERLRFVEAMKEATAINVQIHVEEFKKELTREVLLMIHEVGRLQRERQTLEQKIADLFAFYSKQKHSAEPATRATTPQPTPNLLTPTAPTPRNLKPLPSMRRRPLPSPRPSPRPASSMG